MVSVTTKRMLLRSRIINATICLRIRPCIFTLILDYVLTSLKFVWRGKWLILLGFSFLLILLGAVRVHVRVLLVVLSSTK